MANPTTNYSFAMPTNTDLVKDLPADFDIFGQAVDDRIKALNPETTAGDISYRASTANAKTRLPIGTAGQVLTVNSGATAPEWATSAGGGMTLISTTTMSGASLALTSIPATYKDLYIVIRNWLPATSGSQMIWSFNQDTAANRHYYNVIAPQENAISFNNTIFAPSSAASNSVSNNLTTIYVPDYTNTTTWKMAQCKNVNVNSANSAQLNHVAYDAYYNQTGAISSFAVSMNSGNMTSGTILLYGVK
jgi:hypothetical protein